MLEHLVIMKFKGDEACRNEVIAKLTPALHALKVEIPEIEDLSCGANFSDRSQGFHFGLRVQLAGKAALEVYRQHPAHQKVLTEMIKPHLADVIAIDYLF